eukprot:3790771-Pyramimonas_sp.AAC.1
MGQGSAKSAPPQSCQAGGAVAMATSFSSLPSAPSSPPPPPRAAARRSQATPGNAKPQRGLERQRPGRDREGALP